jgi:acetyl-CoA acetyltransferase
VRAAYVLGVGMTPFGKFPNRSLRSLGRDAAHQALRDAAIFARDVDLLACGNARSGMLEGRESGLGQVVGWEVGIEQVPVYNVKAYCASGATALNVAHMAVAGGFAEIALAVGLEKMSRRPEKGRTLTSDGMEIEDDLGFTPPAYYAMAARRHMEEYGTTREQLAMVAVKNRQAAAHNPRAQYRDAITVQDVLNSRPVVGPLHLFDCCPTGDGAAAAVIVSEERLLSLDGSRATRIDASVLATGRYSDVRRDLTRFTLDAETARSAYEQAGVGPEDLDVAEVHDAFTIAEIIHYEDLGLCNRGEGGRLVTQGATGLGGRMPVSTSGGLLTKGHPLGATGIAQVVEIVEQLRGESGARQVEGARVGLAHVSGGFLEGDFATSGVTIVSS